MGTTANKLSYLNGTKDLFKDRLNSLGAEITSSTTFRNYLTWLNTFYEEVSDKTDISRNGVIGRISQDTTTGTQLIGFDDLEETTSSGVKYSIKDNVFTLDGTASANIRYIYNNHWVLKTAGNHTLKIDVISGTWTSGIVGLSTRNSSNSQLLYHQVAYNSTDYYNVKEYTSEVIENADHIGFYINSGSVFNNFKFRVILNEGGTSQDYEDFTGGMASPNPNYSQSINTLTGNVPYLVRGKNILKPNVAINNTRGTTTTYNSETGYYTTIGTTTNGYPWIVELSINIPSGTTVSFSTNSQYSIYARFYYETSTYEQINSSGTPYKTLSHDITRVVILSNAPTSTQINETYFIQLEINDEPTSFEPYIEPQTFTIPLGDIKICEISTYKDKIYSSNGRFYLEKNINNTIINGTEPNYTADAKPSGLTYYSFNLYNDNFVMPSSVCYCDKLLYSESSIYTNDIQGIKPTSTGRIKLKIFNSSLNSIQALQTWLSNNNLLMYYIMNTPTTTEITEENYPSLYNALKQIQDYLTAYKINKEFVLGYSSPEIEY